MQWPKLEVKCIQMYVGNRSCVVKSMSNQSQLISIENRPNKAANCHFYLFYYYYEFKNYITSQNIYSEQFIYTSKLI